MANKAISELPQALNVNNQDLFVLEQGGLAKKLPAETFITEQGIINALAEALDGHGGIQSVTLSSVSGRIRTYRITFTDQSATTFQVYDGTSIDRISRTSSSGLDDVYTIFLSDGTTTFFTVHNGADGNVSEAMLNDALKDKAPAVTETTESSAIANFTDGADDMPLHNILAEINPVQDLTYGDPYPAGGGANKFNEDTELGAIGSNGIPYATNDSIRSKTFSACSPNTVYYILGNVAVYFYDSNQTFIEVQYASNNVKTSPANAAYFKFGFYASYGTTYKHDTAANNPSTVTTYSPYSNICPITGHTEVNVTRTGANVWDEEWEQGTIASGLPAVVSSDQIRSKNFCPILPNTTYYATCGKTDGGNQNIYYLSVVFYDSEKNYISFAWTNNHTFTTPSNAYYFKIHTNSGVVIYGNTYNHDISINYPSSDHDYHAYQGNSVSLSWQTEAGTVYGGTIDVATGLLTVDRAYVLFDGSSDEDWKTASGTSGGVTNYRGYITISDIKSFDGTYSQTSDYYICNTYANGTWNGVYAGNDVAGMTGTNWGFGINSLGITTAADLKTYISSHNIQLVYKLATPQTYQLTPQEVKTLLGTNNVWADTGNVSVKYPADTKMFIEKLTMPTEDDLVANQAITSGKYFMIGNSLYLALANIASGAQITIGTNAQRVSLADALNTINS